VVGKGEGGGRKGQKANEDLIQIRVKHWDESLKIIRTSCSGKDEIDKKRSAA